MSALRDDEVMLAMLEYAVEHESELTAGQGMASPPQDWWVRGLRVPPDQRKRAIYAAHADEHIEITRIGNDPFPIGLTPKGRHLVQEWGGR